MKACWVERQRWRKLSTIPEQTRQQIEQIGTVDLVIGLVDQQANEHICQVSQRPRGRD